MKFKPWSSLCKLRTSLYKYVKGLSKSEAIKFILQFIGFVLTYGLVINFALWQLLDFNFTLSTLIAWGIVFFFIKEEMTKVILKIRGIE